MYFDAIHFIRFDEPPNTKISGILETLLLKRLYVYLHYGRVQSNPYVESLMTDSSHNSNTLGPTYSF